MSSITMLSGITKGRAMSYYSLVPQASVATGRFNAANDWAESCVIIIGRQREKEGRSYASQWDLKHIARARAAHRLKQKRQQTMRIKDMRQGLHVLLHTQELSGLLDLYKRLETRGRVLLVCLLCAEAGWLILVNVWLRLERVYLKLRLFLRA